jgi:hypothetical protein
MPSQSEALNYFENRCAEQKHLYFLQLSLQHLLGQIQAIRKEQDLLEDQKQATKAAQMGKTFYTYR